MADFGDRWRVFFIGVILSVWLVIIDGLNFCFNFDEDSESQDWAKILVLLSGFIFCFPVLIGSFMLLVWVKPKVGALLVIIPTFIAGAMRLIATLIGFQDFWQETYLDSTTSGTTDVAIASLQVYLIFDAFYLYRQVGKVTVDNRYEPVDLTDRE